MNKKNFSAYAVVEQFENTIADYCGATHGVAVSSCCNTIFLTALWIRKFILNEYVTLPKRTYPGVACSIKNAGFKVKFKDLVWFGSYAVDPLQIVDSALSFRKGMHRAGQHTCISFHAKKHLPIGRGGMLLTDNKVLADWVRKARFDGRNQCSLEDDDIQEIGWNMYMTPEQAGRGLMLFDAIKDKALKDIDPRFQNYPDLSKIKAYQ